MKTVGLLVLLLAAGMASTPAAQTSTKPPRNRAYTQRWPIDDNVRQREPLGRSSRGRNRVGGATAAVRRARRIARAVAKIATVAIPEHIKVKARGGHEGGARVFACSR